MGLRLAFPWYYALLAHADGLTFIREPAGQPNAGEGVIACQKVTGNEPPASWCCSYAVKNQTDLWRSTWPVVRSGACEEVRKDFDTRGALWTIDQVRAALTAGDLCGYPVRSEFGAGWQFFTVATIKLADGTKAPHAHHTGLVGLLTKTDQVVGFLEDGFVTTEGNAADPALPPSDNGDGAYSGRVRGNVRPIMYSGKLWPADPKVYHFGRPELLK